MPDKENVIAQGERSIALQAENNKKRLFRLLTTGLGASFVITTNTTGFAAYQPQSVQREKIEQTAIIAENQLSNYPLKGLVTAINVVGQSHNIFLNFPNQLFPQSIKDSLFSAVEISREKNLVRGHQDPVLSVAISTDGKTILSGGLYGTVRLWNRKGQLLGNL